MNNSNNSKIEELLFGDKIQFDKAKTMILRQRPTPDVLLGWAQRYHQQHKTDKKRVREIVYLYLLSTDGDAAQINALALDLMRQSEAENMSIAAALFQQAYRQGNQYAAGSYLYCLLNGKGVRKNTSAAANVYYEFQSKGIRLEKAFAEPGAEGISIKLPTSKQWKKAAFKKRSSNLFNSIVDGLSKPIRLLSSLPNEYWAEQKRRSIKRENAAIRDAQANGHPEAGDGCREGGCTESLLAAQRVLFLYLALFGIASACLCAAITGHIPNWMVYSLAFIFFCPSVFAIEGKVSATINCGLLLSLLGYGGYSLWQLDWTSIMSDLTVQIVFGAILICVLLVLCLVLVFTVMNQLMGIWFHYLVSIEWKYGNLKALLFAVVSLAIIFGGGYLLYLQGIIF